MFRKFLERIAQAKDANDAWQNVFYGTEWDENGNIVKYGIDIAYQHEKISWKDYELLTALLDKLA